MRLKLSPAQVGVVRGVIYAVVLGAGAALVAALDSVDARTFTHNPLLLLLVPVIARGIEGGLDQLRGQAPQAGLGSRPADPTAYLAPTLPVTEPEPAPPPPAPLSIDEAGAVVRHNVSKAVSDSMPRAKHETRDRVTAAVLAALELSP